MSNRKRKKKINYGKLALIIIVIVILLGGLTYGFIKGKNLINKDPIVNPKPSPEPPRNIYCQHDYGRRCSYTFKCL